MIRTLTLNLKGFFSIFFLGTTLVASFLFVYNPPLAISILLFFLISWAILVKPEIGIFFIIFTLPLFNIGFSYENPVRINNEFIPLVVIPIILTLLIYLFKKPLFPQNKIQKTKFDGFIDLLFILFFGYGLTSLLWTMDLTHGINRIFILSICFILTKLFPRLITSKKNLQRILKFIPWLGLVLAIQLILSGKYSDFKYQVELFKNFDFVIMLHTFGTEGSLRMGGFAPVDIAASILAILVFFNIILIYNGGWKIRILLFFHSLLLFYCMLKTASKAGFISLLVGIFSLPLIVPELRNKIIKLTSAGLVALSVVLVLAGKILVKRIQIMLSGEVDFLQDRIGWWREGFNYLHNTWGIGVGAGGFAKIIDPIPAAHSFYFSILFEYGIIGFILFMLFIGIIIDRIVKSLPNISENFKFMMYCLLGSLITLFVHGFVELEYTYLMLWFLLGLMLTIVKVSNDERLAKGQKI